MLLRLSLLALLCALAAPAQIGLFSKQQLVAFTPDWKGERFEDGRPKVPDSVLARLKNVSAEEAWGVIRKAGYRDHFESGWRQFNPGGERLVGRVVTAEFMPFRPDFDKVVLERGKEAGFKSAGENTWVIDTLVRGDVLVADLFGKYNFMGDNLANAIYNKTGTGVVINGGARDLSGIQQIAGMTGYVRYYHPSSVTRGWRNTMLTGINKPVRIGETTVMPGDVVLGDPEGLVFIPAHLAEEIATTAEQTQLRDEWSRMVMKAGKYSASQIDTKWTEEMLREFEAWVKSQR